MKRSIPLAVLMVIAALSFIPFFTPNKGIELCDQIFRNKVLKIVVSFALILGLGSLLQYHWDRLKRRRPMWFHSLVLIVSMAISSIIGLFGGFQPGQGFKGFPFGHLRGNYIDKRNAGEGRSPCPGEVEPSIKLVAKLPHLGFFLRIGSHHPSFKDSLSLP